MKINLVDLVSESNARTAADYPWADKMVTVITKIVPKAKLHDLYDGDGIELVGPNEADGRKLAVKLADAFKKAGFAVKHGTDEFDNEIFAINEKGSKEQLVISESAESFVDGSWVVMLHGAASIQWSSESASSRVPSDKAVKKAAEVLKRKNAAKIAALIEVVDKPVSQLVELVETRNSRMDGIHAEIDKKKAEIESLTKQADKIWDASLPKVDKLSARAVKAIAAVESAGGKYNAPSSIVGYIDAAREGISQVEAAKDSPKKKTEKKLRR